MFKKKDEIAQIKITDKVLAGVYANSVRVVGTGPEVIMDFINVYPDKQGIVTARVIMAKQRMDEFIAALTAPKKPV